MNKGTKLLHSMMNTNVIRKQVIVGVTKNLELNCLDEGKSDKAIYTCLCKYLNTIILK